LSIEKYILEQNLAKRFSLQQVLGKKILITASALDLQKHANFKLKKKGATYEARDSLYYFVFMKWSMLELSLDDRMHPITNQHS
jgi:hypothetical protein